jgi:pimeloyl-ACP methyl ester carboxylesterase
VLATPSPALAEPPTVFVVPGALDRAASFAALDLHLRHLEVVREDRPGYGRRVGETPAETVDAAVDDIVKRLDGRRAVLVGHSVGALLALQTAAARPDLVVAVAAFEPPTAWEPTWPEGGIEVGRLPDGPIDTARVAEEAVIEYLGLESWTALPTRGRALRRDEGAAFVADLRLIEHEPSGWGTAPVPVVVGTGRRSKPWFREAVPVVARRVRAPLMELPTRHAAHVEDPTGFAAFVSAAVALGQPQRSQYVTSAAGVRDAGPGGSPRR